MKVKKKQLVFAFLIAFLINSAGIFSPITSPRDVDPSAINQLSANLLNRIIMATAFMYGLLEIRKSPKVFLRYTQESIPYFALMAFALVSCTWSSSPQVSLIRYFQQISILTFSFGVICSLKVVDLDQAIRILFFTIIIAGTLFIPFSFAWMDIGYRGIHGHKNTAGYLYGLSALYFYHRFWYKNSKVLSFSALLCSTILLILSQSKTSIYLAVLSIAIFTVSVNRTANARTVLALLCIGISTAITAYLLSTDNATLVRYNLEFTGRTTIWSFVIHEMQGHEWLGYGYRAFWTMGDQGVNVLYGDEFDNFITQLNQSHNSLIDIWVMLGFIGVGLFLILLYDITVKISSAGGMHYMFFIFVVVHSFMETDFFRSNNLLWTLLILMYLFSIKNQIDIRPLKILDPRCGPNFCNGQKVPNSECMTNLH